MSTRGHVRNHIPPPLWPFRFPGMPGCFALVATDISNSIIMNRLFMILFKLKVAVVASSNRAPEDLYEGGINRSLFAPFIDTVRGECGVVDMGGGGGATVWKGPMQADRERLCHTSSPPGIPIPVPSPKISSILAAARPG